MSSRLLETKPIPKAWTASLTDAQHDRILLELEPIILAGKIPWYLDGEITTKDEKYPNDPDAIRFVKVPKWERDLMDQIGAVVADSFRRHAPEFVKKVEAFNSGKIPLLLWDNLPTRGNPRSLTFSDRITDDALGTYNEIIPLGLATLLGKKSFIPFPIGYIEIKKESRGRARALYWHCDACLDELDTVNMLSGGYGRKNAQTAFVMFEDIAKHPAIADKMGVFLGNNFRFEEGGNRYKPLFEEKDGKITVTWDMNVVLTTEKVTLNFIRESGIVPKNGAAIEALIILDSVFKGMNSRLSMDTTRMDDEEKERVQKYAANDRSIKPYTGVMGPGRGAIFSQKRVMHARMEYSLDPSIEVESRNNRVTYTDKAAAKKYRPRELERIREGLPDKIRSMRHNSRRDFDDTPAPEDTNLADVYDEPRLRLRSASHKGHIDQVQKAAVTKS